LCAKVCKVSFGGYQGRHNDTTLSIVTPSKSPAAGQRAKK
jgi:hypothetical protein